MGWEDRDWAKWDDDERGRFYGVLTARHWLIGVVALLIAVSALAFAGRELRDGRGADALPEVPTGITDPTVLYGWRHVPVIHSHDDPSTVGDFIGGKPVLCTSRQRETDGTWGCVRYTYVQPGVRVVVMPPSSALELAPCSGDVLPGGKPAPCPTIQTRQ